jgi:hypothetical protein
MHPTPAAATNAGPMAAAASINDLARDIGDATVESISFDHADTFQ